jgi:hypothetical protein
MIKGVLATKWSCKEATRMFQQTDGQQKEVNEEFLAGM